jgi:hypothetical protein
LVGRDHIDRIIDRSDCVGPTLCGGNIEPRELDRRCCTAIGPFPKPKRLEVRVAVGTAGYGKGIAGVEQLLVQHKSLLMLRL